MEDLLGAFFGGGMGGMMSGMMGGGGGMRRRRGEDVGIPLHVTLEELFLGTKTQAPREKSILCPDCSGSGARRAGSTTVCRQCRGQGMTMQMRMIGPGMVTQQPAACDACRGQGTIVADRDKCPRCQGGRVIQASRPLSVTILPGMKHGEQIPFPGEGDEDPSIAQPGDVVVLLQCKDHPEFKRDGDDLRLKMTITLAQSLCGADLSFRHLDGRKIHVRPPKGRLIEPDSSFKVPGEGMPMLNRHRTPTGRRGDLYVDFTVTFPRHLTEASVRTLKAVLPAAPACAEYDEEHHEECHVTPAPLDEIRKEMKKEVSDDEEEGEGGPQHVSCAHQ